MEFLPRQSSDKNELNAFSPSAAKKQRGESPSELPRLFVGME
jgi:hypothetical protein